MALKLRAAGLLSHVISMSAPAGSQRRGLLEAACQARGCLSYNLDLEASAGPACLDSSDGNECSTRVGVLNLRPEPPLSRA